MKIQTDCERSMVARSDLAQEMKGTVGADNTCLALAVGRLSLPGDAALCASVQEEGKGITACGPHVKSERPLPVECQSSQ